MVIKLNLTHLDYGILIMVEDPLCSSLRVVQMPCCRCEKRYDHCLPSLPIAAGTPGSKIVGNRGTIYIDSIIVSL